MGNLSLSQRIWRVLRGWVGPRLSTGLLLLTALPAAAQAPNVPIYRQGRKESEYEDKISAAARALLDETNAVKLQQVKIQLKRGSCALALPKLNTRKLSPREVCSAARQSHLRVGWCYLCDKCEQWHINLAGGFVLTADGAVATCYHVINPARELRVGCLIAANEEGAVLPVTEVLAANRYSDTCIVRIQGNNFRPLPLQTNVYPGDLAFCYSDPLDHRGYFSHGIVNRFYQFPGRRPFSAPPSAAFSPTRLNVSTDWAPGSSGSAVLDEYGNAIGHVSTIAAVSDDEESEPGEPRVIGPTMIVFHEAVSARDVLGLIKPAP